MTSSPNSPPARPLVVSAALHVVALLLLNLRPLQIPRIPEAKIPGTAHGDTILTYYSPGSRNSHQAGEPLRPTPSLNALPAPTAIRKQTAPSPPSQDAAALGLSNAAVSGLGQGDMRIALPVTHPDPAPNLATLKPGSGGDVVLDAVIDETGHIIKLTVLSSLGPSIDQSVISTVQQWIFTPATLDGKPISSGQVLLFHYQRKDTSA